MKDAPRVEFYTLYSFYLCSLTQSTVGWFQGLVLGISWFLFTWVRASWMLDYKTEREKVSQVTWCLYFALITFRSLIMRTSGERDSSYWTTPLITGAGLSRDAFFVAQLGLVLSLSLFSLPKPVTPLTTATTSGFSPLSLIAMIYLHLSPRREMPFLTNSSKWMSIWPMAVLSVVTLCDSGVSSLPVHKWLLTPAVCPK